MSKPVLVDCSMAVAQEMPERYLRGELTAADQESYEKHYFECTRCFEDLKLLQAVQAELRKTQLATAVARTVSHRRLRPSSWWLWLGGMAAAAGLTGIAILVLLIQPAEQVARVPNMQNEPTAAPATAGPGVPRQPGAATSQAPQTAPTTTAQHPANAGVDRARVIRRLAGFTPPTYAPRVWRGAEGASTSQFQDGMRAYVAGDYAAAVRQLEKAAALEPGRADISFYLGASRLLSGATGASVVELRRTVSLGESGFEGDAHYLLGKALLIEGDAPSARREFAAAAESESVNRQDAQAILAELERLENQK